MRVHKNTLSLLGYPSRVKRPFSGPPIFFKKESRLLLDIEMPPSNVMFVYVDLHFRLLDDGSFKAHVFIWRGYGAMGKRGRWGYTIK
jgi:hypothetical protein